MILVIGKPDSGKSEKAEELVLQMSESGKRIYLATMIPFGEEGEKRVRKHRKMREGKGFCTIECPSDITGISIDTDAFKDSVCLLECVSNLVGNEMHSDVNRSRNEEELTGSIVDEIDWLSDRVRELVVVTNEFDADPGFDRETMQYISLVNSVNEALKKKASKIYYITGEEWQIYENN